MITDSRRDIDVHVGRLWCRSRRRVTTFIAVHAIGIIFGTIILPEERSEFWVWFEIRRLLTVTKPVTIKL
jgi:hypothetical protein